MRRYRVLRAAGVARDLELIEEHLFQAYLGFGDEVDEAGERAGARVEDALAYMRTFAARPFRGTEQAAVRPGVRTETHKNVVF